MASEQFSQAVRGSSGQPLSVTSVASIETDEYGSGVAEVSNAYPINVNPAFVVEELSFFAIPEDKAVDLSLANGNTINGIEPKGAGWVLDTLEIDEINVRDPDATGGETSLLAIGDAEAV